MGDSFEESFPTYSELTQTPGWGRDTTAVDLVLAEADEDTRYTETSLLGQGGMGKVVVARDARVGREVALKVLHTERDVSAEVKARFLREARVQGQLEHPSIVPVYDIDRRSDGATFFTMRRIIGRTLKDILQELRAGGSKYTQRELLKAFETVCLAIDYAHSRGVIHRDLKPSNLMLGDFGEVYVMDWGIARIADATETQIGPAERLSRPGTMLGTPLYMAPEQVADPEVGPEADVFALGAILFEILTLETLRDPRSVYEPIDARPSVRAPEREIAPELETICVKATQIDVENRYPTARVLQESIARYLEGDRAIEQRRELAAGHDERAREALRRADEPGADRERERDVATRELVRALALDPTDRARVAKFAELMASPPEVVPPEVEAQLAEQTSNMTRTGSKFSTYAMLAWYAFLPLLLALGIRSYDYVLMIAVPVTLCIVASYLAIDRPHNRVLNYLGMVAWVFAAMSVSRVFGPLILMPQIITGWTGASQTHPERAFRVFCLVSAAIALVLPSVLEWIGVLTPSYSFTGGHFEVLPQMVGFSSASLVYIFMMVAGVASTLAPALLVSQLRRDLSKLELRSLIQAWHFRRLPEDLMAAR